MSDKDSESTCRNPFCTSITGADDEVSVEKLLELQKQYPFVEWALLYFPEKEGQPRNPTAEWRAQFLKRCTGANTALHLCGTKVFREILAGAIPEEFARYGRLQVNINARRPEFTDTEVLTVYASLLEAGHRLILQCHEESEPLIVDFVQTLRTTPHADRVDVLFDASRGKGKQPELWPIGFQFPVWIRCGYAGGITPENIVDNLSKIRSRRAQQRSGFWMDGETGMRTDNHFDHEKVERVLSAVAQELAS